MRLRNVTGVLLTAALFLPRAATAQLRSADPEGAFASEAVLAEAAAGALLGFGFSWGMAYVGQAAHWPSDGEDPGLGGVILGFATGLAVGTSLGVHLVARGRGLPARYVEALGGALAGVLLVPVLPNIDLDQTASVVAIYAVPTVMAVLASSLGSSSRLQPIVRRTRGGVGVGVSVRP